MIRAEEGLKLGLVLLLLMLLRPTAIGVGVVVHYNLDCPAVAALMTVPNFTAIRTATQADGRVV